MINGRRLLLPAILAAGCVDSRLLGPELSDSS